MCRGLPGRLCVVIGTTIRLFVELETRFSFVTLPVTVMQSPAAAPRGSRFMYRVTGHGRGREKGAYE